MWKRLLREHRHQRYMKQTELSIQGHWVESVFNKLWQTAQKLVSAGAEGAMQREQVNRT